MRRGPVNTYRPVIDLDLGYVARYGYRNPQGSASATPADRCGTPAAIALHRRRNESLCDSCRPLDRERNRANYLRRRGVLVGEPALFAADPVGLSHTACIEKRLRQLAAASGGGR